MYALFTFIFGYFAVCFTLYSMHDMLFIFKVNKKKKISMLKNKHVVLFETMA